MRVAVVAQTAGALFVHGDALRPDLDRTYSFLDSLLDELAGFFESEFFHLGGDELPKAAWAGNATVAAWMAAKGFDNDAAMAYFVRRVHESAWRQRSGNKTLVYWEEVFTSAGKGLPVGMCTERITHPAAATTPSQPPPPHTENQHSSRN